MERGDTDKVAAPRARNPWSKTRPLKSDPYYSVSIGDWTWKVYKVYGDPRKPFARAFCAVSSPGTHGGADYGDEYTAKIPGLISAWLRACASAQ